MGFPNLFRIHLGDPVETFIKWITINYEGFFDSIKGIILWFLIGIQRGLIAIPWFVLLILLFLIGWKVKSIKAGISFSLMLLTIGLLGYWNDTMLTLAIVLTSVLISLIIGIPIGIFSAYKEKFERYSKPVLDAMQTMPSFVYLIPAIMLFGLGSVPAVFATMIYSLPPVIRLTTLAIKSVSSEMLEAANSFGATQWQILIKVELPQALPTIMAGVNQTTMMAMSMVVIASMIGAKGLGYNVLIAINRTDIGMGVEAGTSIVLLAIIIDRLTQAIGSKFEIEK
ncbi:proline/glycine betaine ABC transporter permease [Helicovermis profundi]|uniref:Proline/glycine betaine ABC transporter permease n=2 Tax=Helicovermis profundi TaxID=3065157 RepID=A0AAU9E5S0_9FIRM|nr:proline/glycine betaine ABC transporter permease [Clostridia bacterium S502]